MLILMFYFWNCSSMAYITGDIVVSFILHVAEDLQQQPPSKIEIFFLFQIAAPTLTDITEVHGALICAQV